MNPKNYVCAIARGIAVAISLPTLAISAQASVSKCRSQKIAGFQGQSQMTTYRFERNNSEIFNQLKNYKVLLFTGLTGDLLKKVGPGITGSPYYGSLPTKLHQQGIDHEIVNWPGVGGGSVARNALAVAKAIRTANKKVIVVAHSKGGADVSEAIRTNADLFKSKVKGVILLQSAFRGSPLADGKIASTASGIFKGIGSMATTSRSQYAQKNIHSLCRAFSKLNRGGIKVINLVTSKKPPYDGLIRLYHATLGKFPKRAHHCGLDDGFVDASEAMIPCKSVSNQHLRGYDHLNLLFKNEKTEEVVLSTISKVL